MMTDCTAVNLLAWPRERASLKEETVRDLLLWSHLGRASVQLRPGKRWFMWLFLPAFLLLWSLQQRQEKAKHCRTPLAWDWGSPRKPESEDYIVVGEGLSRG